MQYPYANRAGGLRALPLTRARLLTPALLLTVTWLLTLTACGSRQEAAWSRPATVTLDPASRYQTIDSWAVYPRYWEHDKVNNRYDNSYAQHAHAISSFLVEEVGINGVRVEIWSGLENPEDHWQRFFAGEHTYEEDKHFRYQKINDNADPLTVNPQGFQFSKFDHRVETMVLPIKRAVEARGERLHVNVNYVDFRFASDQGSLSHADDPEEFAEFVLVYFQRLRDRYGVVPDSFEVVLEPDNTESWDGEDIGRGLLAVKARLAADGFHPDFLAPSAASMTRGIEYFDQMAEVPGALEALDVFAYHRYGRQSVDLVEAIRERAEAHGLRTAMLEKINAGIDELLEDLTVGQVSSWQQWAVAGVAEWEDKAAFYLTVDMSEPARPGIEMASKTPHLSQVFRYVRAGAERTGAVSTNPDKRPVAFVNEDGTWAVIVRAQHAGGPLAIEGLPPGRYGMRYVDGDNGVHEWPVVSTTRDSAVEVELPGPGSLAVFSLEPSARP